ncbi:MAG: DUF3995 domain-containing protein [Pseudomonadota bacterium]
MITIVAALAALVLFALSILHAIWGLGSTWPEADAQSLARRVAGFRGVKTMPRPAACFFVAAALAFAALVALAAAGLVPTRYPAWIILTALSAVAAAFIVRGMMAFAPRWREMTPEEPFATLDRRYYGPLCLIIGGALTFIVFMQRGF